MENYTLLKEQYIDDIDSSVKLYRHNKSGARVCTISNDDPNKVFSIAFRTPAINNTGLTHILEHSVLCGSKKYPVKDPFVELLKSSLNTFLNAFTFPDKTMYPVASLNLKDFNNLIGVYMDAVFYPNIYNHEEIFMQEGWRYEILNKEDEIKYNGVVYNEMKGAYSDPEEIFQRLNISSLYPDNTYSYESGGDPMYIPDLSYEEFLKFHKEYYAPSNSYIFIYGNCNMEEEMAMLDRDYLKDFDVVDFDTTIKPQKRFDEPRYKEGIYQADKDLKDKTYLSYNISFAYDTPIKDLIGLSILIGSLFDVPGAPLKEAIENSKLGKDINSYFETDVFEPYVSIMLNGSNGEKQEEFINLINNELNKLYEKSVDEKTIESMLNHAEFLNRERNFSSATPKGLIIAISGMSSWLYSEDGPYKTLDTIKYYRELKDDLKNGYFNVLLKKYLIDNKHKSFVKLSPSHDANKDNLEKVKARLKAYKESLSDEELDKLIEKNKSLKLYQKTPSTKEELNTLPKLRLEDLDRNTIKYKYEEVSGEKFKVIFSDYKTNGIAYVRYLFDISGMSKNEYNVVNLFTGLIKELSTEKHLYLDINQEILSEHGGIDSAPAFIDTINGEAKVYLVFSFSTFKEKIDKANELLKELMFETKFDDYDRLHQLIGQAKMSLQSSVAPRGSAMAALRASSFILESSYYQDLSSGIGLLDYLCYIYDNFDSIKEELVKSLKNVKNVMAKSNILVNVVGDKEILKSSLVSANKLYDVLVDEPIYKKTKFEYRPRKELIKTTFDVNYVALVGRNKYQYSSRSLVLENALSMDYLWNNIRVLGGAYGARIALGRKLITFTSYRDPNIDKTYDTFKNTPKYIEEFNPNEDELLNYKIGAIGANQTYDHVKAKGKKALIEYISGYTYEIRMNGLNELIDSTVSELKDEKEWIEGAIQDDSVCVIASQKSADESKIKFDEVRDLLKK
ncbi:MAG: insulinase family protein [Gammaproteobacteria bacterium]|nr:insulinase family protein [Gammaproteobacteria bacterium]